MSFYRNLLAAVAAIAIASPVFADDTTTTTTAPSDTTPAATTTTTTTTATDQSMASTDTKVDVNKASAKDLMKVKGINASKARAIVAYRKKHGMFKTLDDLAKVKGFSRMKSDDMKTIEDQLTVE